MPKPDKSLTLLLTILAFSFLYRGALVFWQTFPPGADIGLHNSIINSITHSGQVNFLWNYYHMGGGASDTFPGYHIFTASIILITGLPNYTAQGLVVSVFSTFTIAVAFLLTRKVWNQTAALVVAFLVAVSRYDIEMLMWSGYPNVLTLMLIPLAFYLFLEKDRFSKLHFLVATSLVSAAIFLTHSLSALVFGLITLTTFFVILIFPKKVGERRITAVWWILPLIIGALTISPFLVQVIPDYLSIDAAVFTGGVISIQQALLSSRLLPLDIILALFGSVLLYFLFSKHYKGKFLTLPTVLLVLWWLIPTALTQAYLVGLYTDYLRFLYFAILPIILLIGIALYHVAGFFANNLDRFISAAKTKPEVLKNESKTLQRLTPHLSYKNFQAMFCCILVLVVFLSVPLFVPPQTAVQIQNFYQVATPAKYDAIQWANQNTPANAVFLADAQYGWWLSGFAKRVTISGVDPQFLTNAREFEPALLTSRLLDTDYLIDNGFIQVRQDGGFSSRHNPEILAKMNDSYYPVAFLCFDSSDITITLRNSGKVEVFLVSELSVKDMHIETTTDYASIYITWGNELFNFTQKTTVYQGIRFVNIAESLQTNNPTVSFDTFGQIVSTDGVLKSEMNSSAVTLIDPNAWVAGQLVFQGQQPIISQLSGLQTVGLDLLYNLNATSKAELNFYASAFEYPSNLGSAASPKQGLSQLLEDYNKNYLTKLSDLPLDVFSYSQAITTLNATYIVVTDSQQLPRFSGDPLFNCVFANNEVFIFQIKDNKTAAQN